jgi:ABC-type arginine/histidine transport system permease subunit
MLCPVHVDRVIRLLNGSAIVATVTVIERDGNQATALTSSGERYRVYAADCFTYCHRLYCSGFQSLGR